MTEMVTIPRAELDRLLRADIEARRLTKEHHASRERLKAYMKARRKVGRRQRGA
jgi:hypothetical protein